MVDSLPPGAIPANSLEYWASLGNLHQLVRALGNNPNVNIRGSNGYTAIHAAVVNGHTDAIQFLVSHGADVNAKLDSGETPLQLAELAGNRDVANLLRSFGAVLVYD